MATLPTHTGDDLTPEQLFLGHLELIEAIVAHCCRRSRFRPQEAEDFQGTVMLKLIEENYGVFRKFQERSTMKTYLTVTIKRLLLDYQNHIWTKWRPSAKAVELGPVAVRLERLIVRDRFTFNEACQVLWGEGVELSERELAEIWAKLPPKYLRDIVPEREIGSVASDDLPPDQHYEQKGIARAARRICSIVYRTLETLHPEDQLLVNLAMKFKVADIARMWRTDQKPLYRRLSKIYAKLRKELERQGVRRQDVEDLFRRLPAGFPDF
jgi:RNA polymerase sigma factor for flagellar operon FliA